MEYFKAQRRRANNWSMGSVVLDLGELGFESETGRCKMGDGVSVYSALPYLGDTSASGIQRVDKGNRVSMFATAGQVVYDTDFLCLFTFDGADWRMS